MHRTVLYGDSKLCDSTNLLSSHDLEMHATDYSFAFFSYSIALFEKKKNMTCMYVQKYIVCVSVTTVKQPCKST